MELQLFKQLPEEILNIILIMTGDLEKYLLFKFALYNYQGITYLDLCKLVEYRNFKKIIEFFESDYSKPTVQLRGASENELYFLDNNKHINKLPRDVCILYGSKDLYDKFNNKTRFNKSNIIFFFKKALLNGHFHICFHLINENYLSIRNIKEANADFTIIEEFHKILMSNVNLLPLREKETDFYFIYWSIWYRFSFEISCSLIYIYIKAILGLHFNEIVSFTEERDMEVVFKPEVFEWHEDIKNIILQKNFLQLPLQHPRLFQCEKIFLTHIRFIKIHYDDAMKLERSLLSKDSSLTVIIYDLLIRYNSIYFK